MRKKDELTRVDGLLNGNRSMANTMTGRKRGISSIKKVKMNNGKEEGFRRRKREHDNYK